jgi:hypothetical protein
VAAEYSHDVFVSHASEDKDRFVRPLAEALRAGNMTVWYDEWELQVGDRLVDRINDGLARSRFGVVVLSPAFFAKNWPRTELQALATLEMTDGRDRLLPVWLDVGSDEIAAIAPLLLGRLALQASEGVSAVAGGLIRKITGTTEAFRTPPAIPHQLYPAEIAAQALPNSYNAPLDPQEQGFVFRTVTAVRLALGSEAYLNSQHKRAFQAILSDSSIESEVQELVGLPGLRPSPAWEQALPSTGTVVTVSRPLERMIGRGGTVEVRSGLLLHSYMSGITHGVIHLDLVLRPPSETTGGSLLSLDDFYLLLSVPAAAARNEIAPVVSALMADEEEPEFVAQSVVAMPQRDDFENYLNLSAYAGVRVGGATGPHAVHWNAVSSAEFEDPAWHQSVIQMIDRLFSDGSFLDYEHSLERLVAIGPHH